MVSARSLLLGVYTSNSLIRLLFLPSCYLILSSPFIALCVWKFDLHQNYFPHGYTTPDIWPQLFVSIVGIFLATRAISGNSNGFAKVQGKRRVQLLPYWIPGVKHWLSAVFGGQRWLKGVADSTITSIFAYSLAGSKHDIILSTPLLDQLLKDREFLEESELNDWIVLRNACGLPDGAKEKYRELRPGISETLKANIFRGTGMECLVQASLGILSDTLPDLITFNSSVVDQMQWERVAALDLTDGTDEAECELFSLLNEYFCNAILCPITGSSFPESYQLLATDLATFNQSVYALTAGFPRFFPVPGLPGASLARMRLQQNLTRLFHDLTNPPEKRIIPDDESLSGEEDTDADTPTPLTALNGMFSEHDIPIAARAAITLKVLHEIVSEAVPLAFWALLHIYSSSTTDPKRIEDHIDALSPLVRIRGETKKWAEASQPPSIHPSFPAPPEISFRSPDQLWSSSSFPYLRSCISEARRLYASPNTTVRIRKPITLTETDPTRPAAEEQWELEAGTYVDIGISQTLINISSANYLAPKEFKPDRFLHTNAPPPTTSSPYNPSQEFTTALLTSLIAGVVQLWEIAAAPKKTLMDQMREAQAAASGQDGKQEVAKEGEEKKTGTWSIPKVIDGASVKIPKGEVRVRIRRREGLAGPRNMNKGG
ncbi:hypothetical protein BCR34DRAFT_240247 [Clohesyomyces aquaticus]|uniref:Cytochrome P450 n=1 Tax=Clohesyomyces aquaticus TaxID=1231657 RepID=A0A1Y1Y5Q6_9PLEO|nr:hypothetical protein BCR34DRAFT_240247 [Clohesyomyces aquaticus]